VNFPASFVYNNVNPPVCAAAFIIQQEYQVETVEIQARNL